MPSIQFFILWSGHICEPSHFGIKLLVNSKHFRLQNKSGNFLRHSEYLHSSYQSETNLITGSYLIWRKMGQRLGIRHRNWSTRRNIVCDIDAGHTHFNQLKWAILSSWCFNEYKFVPNCGRFDWGKLCKRDMERVIHNSSAHSWRHCALCTRMDFRKCVFLIQNSEFRRLCAIQRWIMSFAGFK